MCLLFVSIDALRIAIVGAHSQKGLQALMQARQKSYEVCCVTHPRHFDLFFTDCCNFGDFCARKHHFDEVWVDESVITRHASDALNTHFANTKTVFLERKKLKTKQDTVGFERGISRR